MRTNNNLVATNNQVLAPYNKYLADMEAAPAKVAENMNVMLNKVHDMAFKSVLYNAVNADGLLARAANAELAMREFLNIC